MDFRKSIVFFLSLLLLVSNTGLAVSVHYCGGEVASVATGFNIDNGCGMEKASSCDKEMKITRKSCCDEKTIRLKSKSGDVTVKAFSVEFTPLTGLDLPDYRVSFQPVAVKEIATRYSYDANGPPFYLLYSSYIFYS